MNDRTAKNTAKRLTASIITIIILIAALGVTTFVLVATSFSADGVASIGTGGVKINLNDGKPVISDASGTFAPGKELRREFKIENLSSCDVWYKFYFTDVDKTLAEDVTVKIKKGDCVLMQGKMSEFTAENASAVDDLLKKGETKTLTISFSLESGADNSMNGRVLMFTFNAKAVQAKNNPDKKFD